MVQLKPMTNVCFCFLCCDGSICHSQTFLGYPLDYLHVSAYWLVLDVLKILTLPTN